MFIIEQLKQLSDFLIQEFKEVFATKEEMDEKFTKVYDDFSTLQKSVDAFSKTEAAPKIGLEYKV